jgi:hypothetical protein
MGRGMYVCLLQTCVRKNEVAKDSGFFISEVKQGELRVHGTCVSLSLKRGKHAVCSLCGGCGFCVRNLQSPFPVYYFASFLGNCCSYVS